MFSKEHFDITVRQARPSDAERISALYREAYSPNGKSDARNYYPFPQFLDADWVAGALNKESLCWLVAVCRQKVIGTVGAVKNIGHDRDQIAESFGLVIKEEFRNKRIGTKLYNFLCSSLRDKAMFLIAETRTANAGGYRIVRRCNFIPIGFEPFAHYTPAGQESMLITARISGSALLKRKTKMQLTEKAHSLAVCVLESLKTPIGLSINVQGEKAQIKDDVTSFGTLTNDPSLNLVQGPEENIATRRANITRDDVSGPKMLSKLLAGERCCRSGVISLSRLEGQDKDRERFDCQHFIVDIDRSPVACARFVIDKIDKRSRLINFQTAYHSLENWIIGYVLKHIQRRVKIGLHQVVVDIKADKYKLQQTLEALHFMPTAYYPAFIEERNQRIDAIQYTHFMLQEHEKGFDRLQKLEWPLAQGIARTVSEFWS